MANSKAAATTFQPIKLDTLPRRNPGSVVDIEAAKALLAIVQDSPSEIGATDGTAYKTSALARAAGLRAMRLLSHVAPDGMKPSLRTGPVDGGFAFAVTLKPSAESDDATAE